MSRNYIPLLSCKLRNSFIIYLLLQVVHVAAVHKLVLLKTRSVMNRIKITYMNVIMIFSGTN